MHIHIHHHGDTDFNCEVLRLLEEILKKLDERSVEIPDEVIEKLNVIISDLKTTI